MHPLPVPGGQPREAKANGEAARANAAPALAPASSAPALAPVLPEKEEGAGAGLSSPLARLPVELEVTVPVRDFRVRHLLALEPGRLIESQWGNGDDVPLASGDVQLAWSEFEVMDTQMAVRITRLV